MVAGPRLVESYGSVMEDKGVEVVHNFEGLRLLTGRSNPQLAQDVAAILGQEVQQPISEFPDGTLDVQIPVSLRRRDVYILQSTSPPRPNTFQMELCLMADAARRASAAEISAIIPYLGYTRKDRQTDQNRPNASREAIGARVIIDQIINAGAERIVSLDIHADQETGFTNLPFDNLYASGVLVPAILERMDPNNLAVLSPDLGGAKRARKYYQFLNAAVFATAYKERTPDGAVEVYDILGDVEGRDVLIVDEELATGTSIKEANRLALDKGAKSVSVAVTHGLFLGNALERLSTEGICRILVTDTVNHRPEVRNNSLVEIVSVAPLLASAVRIIHTGGSIHDLVYRQS